MKELKDMLWKAADKLRGSLSASQYKDVILGLVFLKYVSDTQEERAGYSFVVPPATRWKSWRTTQNTKTSVSSSTRRWAPS